MVTSVASKAIDLAAADFSGVDGVLRDAVMAGQAPGIVAGITGRDGVIYEAAFGAAATTVPAPMRVDTVFRIASMTKLVTSVVVMLLREEGKLDLDDPLVRHLPSFRQPGVLTSFDDRTAAYTVRPASRLITIRDLLTHTSGFGYWFLNRELLREANGRVDYFDAPFLMHDPGARFSYGISTDVLGQIVEPVSGVPLDRFIVERIARPLGMSATSFEPPRELGRLATLHRRRGTGFADALNERSGEAPRGGGGLYTTAADYLALLRMLLNGGTLDGGGRLLSEDAVAAITQNQIGPLLARMQTSAFPERTNDFAFMDGTQKFGFGVMIETRDRDGGRPAGSFGWGGIFNTHFWTDARTGIGAVLLMQMSPFCDPGCVSAYQEFERALYECVDRRPARAARGA